MRTALLPALLLLLAPACGYDVGADGRVVDASGTAQRGVAVTVQALDYASGSLTSPETLTSPAEERVETDDQGRFSVRHHVGGGFFGCGLDDQPVLVVAPQGLGGAIAVAKLRDDPQATIPDLGDLRLPAEVSVDVIDGDVYLGVDQPAYVDVDGQTWKTDERGVLPGAALARCPSAAPCAHHLRVFWADETTQRLAPPLALEASGPTPIWSGALAAIGGLTSDGYRFAATVEQRISHAALYVDGDLAQTDILDASRTAEIRPPAIAMRNTSGAYDFQPLPQSACTRYGTGQRCELPDGLLAAVRTQAGTRARILPR